MIEKNNNEYLIDLHNCCSKECAGKIKNKLESSDDYDLYEIQRCVSYYDCERLNNLRIMCEKKKRTGLTGIFDGIATAFYPVCKPAQVGIIRASISLIDAVTNFDNRSSKQNEQSIKQGELSIQLLESIKEFSDSSSKLNEEMLKHNKSMNWLTKLILILAGATLVMIIVQIVLILVTNNLINI